MFKVKDQDSLEDIGEFGTFEEAKECVMRLYIEQEDPVNIMTIPAHELYRRYVILDSCADC